MKTLRKIAAFFVPALFIGLLIPEMAQSAAASRDEKVAAQAVNAVALDLYGQFRKAEGNLVFSPYSVSLCLAMTYLGARGKTESQMAQALHLSLPRPKVHEAFAAINAHVLAAGQGTTAEINVANALWAEKSYSFQQEFIQSVKINYQDGFRELDFRHGPGAARMTINSWVKEQTKNKITNFLASGTITRDTRLVLTNAMYFKSKWKSEFKKNRTKQDPFTLLDGREIIVPMMHQTDSFRYGEHGDLQVLEMPYKDGQISMIVLLPSKQEHLEDFEQSMTFDKLSHWIGNLKTQRVDVSVPRFKMTSTFQLRPALTKLGMTDAFSQEHADFSGMTGTKDLFISEGIHKALLETNEEGTVAAAASGSRVHAGAIKKRVPIFRADHPFLFLIHHRSTNCTLFLGRVTKP